MSINNRSLICASSCVKNRINFTSVKNTSLQFDSLLLPSITPKMWTMIQFEYGSFYYKQFGYLLDHNYAKDIPKMLKDRYVQQNDDLTHMLLYDFKSNRPTLKPKNNKIYGLSM